LKSCIFIIYKGIFAQFVFKKFFGQQPFVVERLFAGKDGLLILTEPSHMIMGHRKPFSQRTTVAACFLVVAITYGAAFSFGVFLNPLRESFGMTLAAVSGAYSIMLWVFSIFGIVAGWAVDSYGPRITIMVGAFILGSGFLLTGFIDSLWQLYLTCGLIGIGLSSGYVPTMTTISRAFVERRGFALGLNSAGIGFGPLIMAPLITHLILISGWRFAFFVTASIAGGIIPVALLLEKRHNDKNEQIGGEAKNRKGSVKEETGKEMPPGCLKIKWVFKTRTFSLFCLLFMAVGVCVQTVIVHIVAYSQIQGESPMTAAAVLSTATGASMAGRIVMGIASDWIGRRRALIICTFFEGVMLIWLMATSSTWSLFIFAIFFGFFYGGHAPQLPALIGETLGFENMGAILGVINLFWGIGSAIGPFVTGYMFDVTGSYKVGFMIATVLIFSASAIGVLLKTSKLKFAEISVS